MTLEVGKEMDRRCVLGWLNEVYRHPTVAFNTYSDERQIEFAHDALVLLKEQEAVVPKKTAYQRVDHTIAYRYRCGTCDMSIFPSYKYCPFCGQAVKWDG